jgi:NAD(P)-dependent dehydrogenase (short-subunit alcohol dehydrogenase family)
MKFKPTQKAAAIVTGAGSGIGRAFAYELARRGGKVICADINLDHAQETANKIIQEFGDKALAVQCDVSKEDQVQLLASHAEHLLQEKLTLVINNAGIGSAGKVGDTPVADWRAVMNVNLWGVVYGCHYFLPILKRNGGGIINVASAAGFAGAPTLAAYGVSKAGVIALSETMAAELAHANIKVNVLCPTMVPTNIVNNSRNSGRISSELVEKSDIAFNKFVFTTTEAVVKKTLDNLDAGKLYTIPQVDAKLLWLAKRTSPSLYAKSIGFLSRKYMG